MLWFTPLVTSVRAALTLASFWHFFIPPTILFLLNQALNPLKIKLLNPLSKTTLEEFCWSENIFIVTTNCLIWPSPWNKSVLVLYRVENLQLIRILAGCNRNRSVKLLSWCDYEADMKIQVLWYVGKALRILLWNLEQVITWQSWTWIFGFICFSNTTVWIFSPGIAATSCHEIVTPHSCA